MPIEASNRDMDIDMLGIESRTIGGEIPKKLEKMLIQRSTVKRKKDLSPVVWMISGIVSKEK